MGISGQQKLEIRIGNFSDFRIFWRKWQRWNMAFCPDIKNNYICINGDAYAENSILKKKPPRWLNYDFFCWKEQKKIQNGVPKIVVFHNTVYLGMPKI